MTHGSLFSGIGGFDLAAEWIGWQNVFHCEWNTFGQRVLKHYWPDAISYNDITKTDFTIHRGRIDILTGGFPCQPYSMAGKRLGKEDDRHLWPQMLRAIREIQPRWVVGENVLGLVNWSNGLVFHEVQADLEAEGYEVQPFVLPAVSVNAPHRRDRVWFVAHSYVARFQTPRAEQQATRIEQYGKLGRNVANTDGSTAGTPGASGSIKGNRGADDVQQSERREQTEQHNRASSFSRDATDTNGNVQYKRNSEHEEQSGEGREYAQRDFEQNDITNTESIGQEYALENRELERRRFRKSNQRNAWDSFPSVSPICDGNDGIPDRLDGITFSKWRKESIKAGGNAVVPQVVLQIFRTIEDYEKTHAQ